MHLEEKKKRKGVSCVGFVPNPCNPRLYVGL